MMEVAARRGVGDKVIYRKFVHDIMFNRAI